MTLHRVGDALQMRAAPVDVADAGKPSCEVTVPSLTITSPPWAIAHSRAATLRAAPRKEPSSSSIGLAGVDPDPDVQREIGIGIRLLRELPLEVHRGSDRLPRRLEDNERLVTPDLDQLPAAKPCSLVDDVAELRRQPRGGLIPVLLREAGVAADVCDQKRANGCVCRFSMASRHPRECGSAIQPQT